MPENYLQPVITGGLAAVALGTSAALLYQRQDVSFGVKVLIALGGVLASGTIWKHKAICQEVGQRLQSILDRFFHHTASTAPASTTHATEAQAAAVESASTVKNLYAHYLGLWDPKKREFNFHEGFDSQAFIDDMVRHTKRFARTDVDPNIHYGHAVKIDLDPRENPRIGERADLHGDLYSLLVTLQELQKQVLLDEQLKCKPGVHLILLGDYGDRGSYTTQVLTLLMRLREENPKQVHLIRGNHEEHEVNRTDRFKYQDVKGMRYPSVQPIFPFSCWKKETRRCFCRNC